jgi:hypothetical protein
MRGIVWDLSGWGSLPLFKPYASCLLWFLCRSDLAGLPHCYGYQQFGWGSLPSWLGYWCSALAMSWCRVGLQVMMCGWFPLAAWNRDLFGWGSLPNCLVPMLLWLPGWLWSLCCMAPGLSVSALLCWSTLESVLLGYWKLGSGWRPLVDVWWLLCNNPDFLHSFSRYIGNFQVFFFIYRFHQNFHQNFGRVSPILGGPKLSTYTLFTLLISHISS